MEININTNNESLGTKRLPMKWYCWVIVTLSLSTISLIGSAGQYLSGTIYLSDEVTNPKVIYDYYGLSLKILDIFYGSLILLLATLSIITIYKLLKYKLEAPKFLYTIRIMSIILPILYSTALYFITNTSPEPSPLIVTTIITFIILFCEQRYFKRRMSLFIN